MTTEELLKPRYKVIADYPGSVFIIGDIITAYKKGWICREIQLNYIMDNFKRYPHLFDPLPWWKDRKVEDMPRYVRSIKQEHQYGIEVGKVIKVKEWVLLSETMYVIQSKTREYHPSCFDPATKEDYNAYLQTTNQNNG